MGASTSACGVRAPSSGGTLLVIERPPALRPALLLDPELPWVMAWRWTRAGRALAAAEPIVPLLVGAPGRARLHAVCAVLRLETRAAIDLADELTGCTLAQLAGPPADGFPDDLPVRRGEEQAELARRFGVRLLIEDHLDLAATAFDEDSMRRLRERYLAVSERR